MHQQLTRRALLRDGAIGAGAPALAGLGMRPAAGAAKHPMLGCDSYSLRRLYGSDPIESVKKSAALIRKHWPGLG